MPLQNRVTPEGEIVAVPERGTMMGNRGGCLHDDERRLGPRRWVSRQWICCVLAFKGRRRRIMAPGRYTELFFLDEATALAAGHRPCFECRRHAALHFARLWARAAGRPGQTAAGEIDAALHVERIDRTGRKLVVQRRLSELPVGTMVRVADGTFLVSNESLRAWTPAGYTAAGPIEQERQVEVLTPPSIIATMKLGYVPLLHETAGVSR